MSYVLRTPWSTEKRRLALKPRRTAKIPRVYAAANKRTVSGTPGVLGGCAAVFVLVALTASLNCPSATSVAANRDPRRR